VTIFSTLAIKPVVTVSPSLALKPVASRARVSQSDLKTDRGAMMGGARGIIVEVASSGS
jgi:hypothetical protein